MIVRGGYMAHSSLPNAEIAVSNEPNLKHLQLLYFSALNNFPTLSGLKDKKGGPPERHRYAHHAKQKGPELQEVLKVLAHRVIVGGKRHDGRGKISRK